MPMCHQAQWPETPFPVSWESREHSQALLSVPSGAHTIITAHASHIRWDQCGKLRISQIMGTNIVSLGLRHKVTTSRPV